MSFAKLRGAIREKFDTQDAFADALGISPATLSKKLNGRTEWTLTEIEETCVLLGVSPQDSHAYFFTK